MNRKELKAKIQTARIMREKGKVGRAQSLLTRTAGEAAQQGFVSIACEAYAELIVCHQHNYERGHTTALEDMRRTAENALRLITEHTSSTKFRKPFYYRLGVHAIYKKDYETAEGYFRRAIRVVYRYGKEVDIPEYLGYLAYATELEGKRSGLNLMRTALKTLRNNYRSYEDYHFLIIESGLLQKQAHIYHLRDTITERDKVLKHAKVLAVKLKQEYHMAQRLLQFNRLCKTLGIKQTGN
ncbi:MAG: hypothetical protein KW793_00190 [Candidatus Doudnabacteria bacterium]|nr:hypothetical protein [Candidatus Doudnabacteria bacterium]